MNRALVVQSDNTPADAFTGLLKMLDFVHRLQRVIRCASVPGRDTRENDVEHSYSLAVCALYVFKTNEGKFAGYDLLKIILYCLIHDMEEPYTGDFTWDMPSEHKPRLQAEAVIALREEFPEFTELADMLESYQRLVDKESWFVKVLDKIVSSATIFLSGGKSWQESGQTRGYILEKLEAKVCCVPATPMVRELLKALVRNLERSPEMFAMIGHPAA